MVVFQGAHGLVRHASVQARVAARHVQADLVVHLMQRTHHPLRVREGRGVPGELPVVSVPAVFAIARPQVDQHVAGDAVLPHVAGGLEDLIFPLVHQRPVALLVAKRIFGEHGHAPGESVILLRRVRGFLRRHDEQVAVRRGIMSEYTRFPRQVDRPLPGLVEIQSPPPGAHHIRGRGRGGVVLDDPPHLPVHRQGIHAAPAVHAPLIPVPKPEKGSVPQRERNTTRYRVQRDLLHKGAIARGAYAQVVAIHGKLSDWYAKGRFREDPLGFPPRPFRQIDRRKDLRYGFPRR